MKPVIQVENLQKHFGSPRRNLVKAVDGVSFTLHEGEIVGLIGESGCGKSTLARLILKLEDKTGGEIYFKSQSQEELYKKSRLQYYRTIQLIFQNPFDVFDPRQTIREALSRPIRLHNKGKSTKAVQNMVLRTLEKGALSPANDYINRYPHELSGGQLQRIAILRAMLLEPEILIADEPVTMLDVSVRSDIINLLQNLRRNKQMAMLFISHDLATTAFLADRLLVMYLGRIVEEGPTLEILKTPMHPYTKALLLHSNILNKPEISMPPLNGELPKHTELGKGCYFASRCPYTQPICLEKYPDPVIRENYHKANCHLNLEKHR